MQKEKITFKRVSLRKDTIYRIICLNGWGEVPTLRIKYKLCDVTKNENVTEFDYLFNNKESVLEAHSRLIELLNNSKDSDFIDIGKICDEVKRDINNSIDNDDKNVYYKSDN